jgi:hypothetical protein
VRGQCWAVPPVREEYLAARERGEGANAHQQSFASPSPGPGWSGAHRFPPPSDGDCDTSTVVESSYLFWCRGSWWRRGAGPWFCCPGRRHRRTSGGRPPGWQPLPRDVWKKIQVRGRVPCRTPVYGVQTRPAPKCGHSLKNRMLINWCAASSAF